jgi:hypothetical protein
MDEQTIRERTQAFTDALKSGDIGLASREMSPELQRNLGPVVAMLPLPVSDAMIEAVEMTGTGYRAVVRLVGESGETRLETRWKDRDGKPTMVEASHLTEAAEPPALEEGEEEAPA